MSSVLPRKVLCALITLTAALRAQGGEQMPNEQCPAPGVDMSVMCVDVGQDTLYQQFVVDEPSILDSVPMASVLLDDMVQRLPENTVYQGDRNAVLLDPGRGVTVVSTYGSVEYRITMPVLETGLRGLADFYDNVIVVDVSEPAWNGGGVDLKLGEADPLPLPNLQNLVGEELGLQPRPGNLPGQYIFEHGGVFYQYGGPLQTGANPQTTAVYDPSGSSVPSVVPQTALVTPNPIGIGNQLSGAQLWNFSTAAVPFLEVRHVDGSVARFETFSLYVSVGGTPWVPPGPPQRLWRLVSVRDPYDNEAVYSYNAWNQLTSIQYPNGLRQHFDWHSASGSGSSSWPNWAGQGMDLLQVRYTKHGVASPELLGSSWGMVFGPAVGAGGRFFDLPVYRAYSPRRPVLVDRSGPGPYVIGADSEVDAQIVSEFSYQAGGAPAFRETQRVHDGASFDRVLSTPSDLPDQLILETTYDPVSRRVATQSRVMLGETQVFSYPFVPQVPGRQMAGIEVAVLNGAAPQTRRRYEFDRLTGRLYRVTTTATNDFRGRPRAVHATGENSTIGGVAATDVEPEQMIVEHDYDGTCVCNKPTERREISVRGGQTFVRTWNFEYHPIHKMVTKRSVPNPEAGTGPFLPQVDWSYSYTQLAGASGWGAWVLDREVTPDGTFVYAHTDRIDRLDLGHGQMARTTTRSIAGIRIQDTLTGPETTASAPVTTTVWRNLPNLPPALPQSGVVRGQPRRVVDGDGVATVFEYSIDGHLKAKTVLGDGATGDLRTEYVPDTAGFTTSVTLHALSPLAATTTFVRTNATGVPYLLTSTSAGLREARGYYDRWGHLAVVRQNNLGSTGQKPSRHGAVSQARDWVEEQVHYHYSRVVTTFVDRKPTDESAGSDQFGVTQYQYAADGRLVSVVNPNGSVTTFDFDGYGTVYRTSTTDPSGTEVVRAPKSFVSPFLELTGSYEFTGSDHLWTLVGRNDAGAITSIQQPSTTAPPGYSPYNGVAYSTGGAIQRFALDTQGRVKEVTSHSGTTLLARRELRHDQLGRQTWMHDVVRGFGGGDRHTAWTYEQGKATQLKAMQQTAVAATTYQWNALGLAMAVRDGYAGGNTVLFDYHQNTPFLRSSETLDLEPAGGVQTTTTEYDVNAFGEVVTIRERGPNHPRYQTIEHRYGYTSLGMVDRYTDPEGRVQQYLPDGLGRIVEHARIGFAGDVIRNSVVFGDFGVAADGRTKVARHDGIGNVTIVQYDFAGRPFVIQNPGNTVAPTAAAPNQRMAIFAEYDGASRLRALYDGDLGKTEFFRDGPGHVIHRRLVNQVVGGASSQTNISQWNTSDWMRRDALGRVQLHDYWGDPTGGSIMGLEQFDKDSLGRLHAERFVSAFAPAQVLQVTSTFANGGQFRSGMGYSDSLGLESMQLAFTRDGIGRLTDVKWDRAVGSVGSPSLLAQYGWVGQERKTRTVRYSAGSARSGRTTWSYDDYGRINGISEATAKDGITFVAGVGSRYDYDRVGNLIAQAIPLVAANGWTGVGDRFRYDAYDRLETAWLGVDSATFSAPGYPGTFDATSMHERLTYGLDHGNNRQQTSAETASGAVTTSYTLQDDQHPQGPSDRYDQVQVSAPLALTVLAYDDRGNLKYDGRFLYRYDYLNRLQEVWRVVASDADQSADVHYGVTAPQALDAATDEVAQDIPDLHTRLAREHTDPTFRSRLRARIAGGVVRLKADGGGGRPGFLPQDGQLELVAVYLYDVYNRRTTSVLVDPAWAQTQIHTWDGWRQVAQHRLELVGNTWQATPVKQFVWGAAFDELVAYRRKSGHVWENYFVQHGLQDSATRLVNSAGAVVERYEYDPYGRVKVFVGSGTTPRGESAYGLPFLWKGIRLDEITGLLQMRNRYYSTSLGRFLSTDPLGVWGDGESMGCSYAYAVNNPTTWADPLGESPFSMLAKAIAKQGLKKGMKEFAEKYIENSFKKYLTKNELKEMASEIADILDSLDSSWWEWCLEVIPVVGDLYGGGKLAVKAREAYNRLQDLENRLADKIAKKLKGKERDDFLRRERGAGVREARQDADMNNRVNGANEEHKGLEGHHGDSVHDHPERAGDPRNIEFQDRATHQQSHGGNFQNQTHSGTMVNRN
ncbi:MAG: hypothetical protein JNL08_00470 [Planctomycetes bacterium]|nr:hypothetical protein [Planctomycetota bacterium]